MAFELPDDAKYTCTEHYWYDENRGAPLKPDDVFVYGGFYTLKWEFVSKEGYIFDRDADITLNGRWWKIDESTKIIDGNRCSISSVMEKTAISEFNITSHYTTPIAGEKAGDLLSYEMLNAERYTCTGFFWYNNSKEYRLEPNDIFEEGELYSLRWTFWTNGEGPFDSYAEITLNNGEVKIADSTYVNEDEAYIMTEPIEAIVPELESGIKLMVGKKRVNAFNAQNVFGDGRVSYDDKTKTLTLNSVTILDSTFINDVQTYCSIYADQFITINLVGTNMIYQSVMTMDRSCSAIYVHDSSDTCPPILVGDGSLSVFASDTDVGHSVAIYESTPNMEIASTGRLYLQTGACNELAYSNPISCTGKVLFSGIKAGRDITLVSGREIDIQCEFTEEVTALLFASLEDAGMPASDDYFVKNGDNICFLSGTGLAEVVFSLLEKVIDAIEINDCCAPLIGGKAGDYMSFSIPEDAPYHFDLESMGWINNTDDVYMGSDDLFEVGKSYSFGGCLIADEGYIFDESTMILINGGELAFSKSHTKVDESNKHYFYVWTESQKSTAGVIDTIELDGFCNPVVGSKAGEYITLTVPENAPYHFVEGDSCWYRFSDMMNIDNNDIFEADTLYAFGGTLIADEQYAFAKNPTILINGGEVGIDKDYTYIKGSDTRYFYIFTQSMKADEIVEPGPSVDEEPLLGDANDDKSIDMKDVLLLRKYLAGLTDEINSLNADANGDQSLDMKDVLMIRKYLAGLIEKLGA